MKYSLQTFVGIAVLSAFSTASAAVVTVLPGDSSWKTSNNTGGGSSAITDTAAHSGNGSLELTGDKTRFSFGNSSLSPTIFSRPTTNLGNLNAVSNFTFDWMVDHRGNGAGAASSYSPALRLHIWDNNRSTELVWENAYNGSAPAVLGTWYTTDMDDNFWRTGSGGALYDRSISDWVSEYYSVNAYIYAISVGVGSSAGSEYHAFADNVTLSFVNGPSTTYNFEARPGGAVPDSGGTLLMLGSALTGLALWKRKSTAKA